MNKLVLAGFLALLFALPASATTGGTNGLLAYQALVGKHTQLFTIKPDGSGIRQITRLRDSDATAAAWSPNGQRIAFARDYAAGTSQEHLDIVVMNANGSGFHAFGLHGLNGEPSWSPDGRHVVWGTSRGLSFANSDGSGLRQVNVARFDGSAVFSPDGKRNGLDSWSPDGKKIAFVSNMSGAYAIYTMNVNGTGITRLTRGPEAHLAAWGGTHPLTP